MLLMRGLVTGRRSIGYCFSCRPGLWEMARLEILNRRWKLILFATSADEVSLSGLDIRPSSVTATTVLPVTNSRSSGPSLRNRRTAATMPAEPVPGSVTAAGEIVISLLVQ